MVKVWMNEQHSLLPEQEGMLNKAFEAWEVFPVPANGLTLSEIRQAVAEQAGTANAIVFVSPIPAAMKTATEAGLLWYTFHNDRREKKELPNGKIIMSVAQEGWELV